MEPIIFISHRSTDKKIADMILDFLVGTGIPKAAVFCSSLPGNDIKEKISGEVKSVLKDSTVNISILSRDYYQSAYCMNEAGVIWFHDNVPVIPIALPEVNSDNMYGFLSSEYKLRRLDCDTDISYIYDTVRAAVSAQQSKVSVITYETQKLKERYNQYLKTREKWELASPTTSLADITTDDECIVLYYILKKNVRKISKNSMIAWLHKNEIYDVNVDNAFDLLSSFDGGSVDTDTLEFGIEAFRKYSANAAIILPELKDCVDRHTKLASDTFKSIWNAGNISSTIGLFIAYIVDERMSSFGDRWMANSQVESIKQWEGKNSLMSTLSENYGSCLELFKQNDLVYESSWTSYGNPREYTLCPSLQDLLFNHSESYYEKLEKWKKDYYCDLPF